MSKRDRHQHNREAMREGLACLLFASSFREAMQKVKRHKSCCRVFIHLDLHASDLLTQSQSNIAHTCTCAKRNAIAIPKVPYMVRNNAMQSQSQHVARDPETPIDIACNQAHFSSLLLLSHYLAKDGRQLCPPRPAAATAAAARQGERRRRRRRWNEVA